MDDSFDGGDCEVREIFIYLIRQRKKKFFPLLCLSGFSNVHVNQIIIKK